MCKNIFLNYDNNDHTFKLQFLFLIFCGCFINNHVIRARSLQDQIVNLTFALRLMTRNRRSWVWCLDSKHGAWAQRLRIWDHGLWVWLRIWLLLGLRVLPILQGSKNGDFLPLLTSLNLLWTLLQKMKCFSTLFYIGKHKMSIWNWDLLTGKVRHRLELLFPELGDGNGFIFLHFTINCHPLFGSMCHDALKILRLECVEYVKKILPRRASTRRILIREVLHELSIFA